MHFGCKFHDNKVFEYFDSLENNIDNQKFEIKLSAQDYNYFMKFLMKVKLWMLKTYSY